MPTWPKNWIDGERKIAAAKAIVREADASPHAKAVSRSFVVSFA